MTPSGWDLLVTLRLPNRRHLVTGQDAGGRRRSLAARCAAAPGLAGWVALATTLRHMTEGPSLSLAEHAILAMLSERPAHGFAIARLTAPGGELGQIWHIPRPVVYRSLGRLLEAGLITPAAVESGRGPQRTVYTVTAPGRQAAARWLDTPVEHVRDVRTQLLLKLALLDRAGRDPTD